jgi:hypothetical protein
MAPPEPTTAVRISAMHSRRFIPHDTTARCLRDRLPRMNSWLNITLVCVRLVDSSRTAARNDANVRGCAPRCTRCFEAR